MRILLVHHTWPPQGVGGSELYAAALARRLAREHEVAVLHRSADADRPDHELSEEVWQGLPVFRINNLHRVNGGFKAYRDPQVTSRAIEVLDRFRPELVHVGHLSGLSSGLVFEARARGAAVVITLHDFWPWCVLGQLLDLGLAVCPGPTPRRCLGCVGGQVVAGRVARWPGGGVLARPLAGLVARTRFGAWAERLIERRLTEMEEVLATADLLISPSGFLKQRVADLGVEGVEVLPNGHEPLSLAPPVPDPRGRVRFGFIGAAIPSKGVHILAEAYRQLAEPRARLQIHGAFLPYHGDHGYEERVRVLLGSEAESVLCGPFPPERLGEVLSQLDVLVVPSLWEENAPIVLQEAALGRRPVLVSDHGGLAEQVREGVDGLRFRPGDAPDLAAKMRRLLDEPELLAGLGSDPASVPDLDEHVAALLPLYERARARQRSRAGRVGVLVVDHGGAASTAQALRSALDQEPAHVLVVENGPAPEARWPEAVERLCLPDNRGFAGGVNAGMTRLRELGCDRVLLLNNDARLHGDCLRRLAEAVEAPGVAAAAPTILRGGDGRIESRGARLDLRSGRVRLLDHGKAFCPGESCSLAPALSGAVLMIRLAAWDLVGAMDEDYFHGFEDMDWCGRVRGAGLDLVVVEGAVAVHDAGGTLGADAPEALYYAVRNHLRVVERLRPLSGLACRLRRVRIAGLNLAHALLRGRGSRWRRVRAVSSGMADFRRGRFGPVFGGPS